MIKALCRAPDGTRRNRKSPNGRQTSRGGSVLACTPQELIMGRRTSESGLRDAASGTKSAFSIIEPRYRSLIVCQRPRRNCVPASRGSIDPLSAPVMDPLSRFAYQVNVQVKIEQCQRGLIGRQRAGNHVLIRRLITSEDFDGFHPGFIAFPSANLLIPVTH